MRFSNRLTHSRGGFTLIELMIVVVISGLLAGLVTYSTVGYIERANRHKARADISTLSGAVQSFYGEKHRFPENQEGLQILVTEKYVPFLPRDPWGHAYVYLHPGKAGGDSYDIISYGKDGREGGSGSDADI